MRSGHGRFRPLALHAGAMLVGLLLASGTARAQLDDWVDIAPAASNLYGVEFPVDALTGYVCGLGTIAYKTTDGGRSWTQMAPGASAWLLGIDFPTADLGFMCSFGAKVFKTTDAGSTWSNTDLPSAALYAMHFPTAHEGAVGYVVGAAGFIFKTVDAGANWVDQEQTETANALYRVEFPVDARTGWTVGDNQEIMKRTGAAIMSGVYTGDGNDDRAITGLGFSPDLVIIKSDGVDEAVFTTSTMTPDATKTMGNDPITAEAADRIQSLDADGFTIGTDATVNTDGETYYWTAWDEVAGEMDLGTYTGDGTDDRPINGIGFQPEYVMVWATGGPSVIGHHFSTQPDDESFRNYRNWTVQPNRIQKMLADGFEVGSGAYVNWNGASFHYAAFNEVAGKSKVGWYVGDGSDDRQITGLGFRPQFLLYDTDAYGVVAAHRHEAMIGDLGSAFYTFASAPDNIQKFEDDGFEIGTLSNSNLKNYYYMAWGGRWDLQTTPSTAALWGLDMIDETTGYACGYSGAVLKTTDGGTTWTDKSPAAGSFAGMAWPTADVGYVGASNGTIYKSTDGASTWTTQTTDTTSKIWDIEFPEDRTSGFAVGESATVLRTKRPLIATGQYFGDGLDDRAITGVGFQPDVVILKCPQRTAICRTSTMSGDETKPLDGGASVGLQADMIQSLDADGFTVGSDGNANKASAVCFWTAFKAQGEIVVGSYSGDGTDNRSITGVGFQPDYLIVMSSKNAQAVHRFADMVGDTSATFADDPAGSNMIQGFESDGFQVGDDNTVNDATATHHYVAFKELPFQVKTGSYLGDGWDDRSITDVGWRPDYLVIKTAAGDFAVQRSRTAGSRDTSFDFSTGDNESNRIQFLEVDGFQVGDHTMVNQVARTYYWVAFGRDVSQGIVPPFVNRWTEADPRP